MASVWLTVCALFLFIPLAKQDSVNKDLQSVINAIEKIIDFFWKDYKNLNLDGLFGLRVIEGHLAALIKEHDSGKLQHLDNNVVVKMKEMREKATHTCNISLTEVKKDKLYFRRVGFVVSTPWNLFDSYRRRVNTTYAWSRATYVKAKAIVKIDEQVSDNCMAELIGSHKSNGKSCDISSKCAHVMSAPGLLGYSLTHQILWTMLAEKAGCRKKLQTQLLKLGRGDISTLRLELCTNNYIQLQETVKKFPMGLIPTIQDLFLEQMFICPSIGYFEFLEPSLLPQILSWQYKNGCYGKMRRTKSKVSLDPDVFGMVDDDYVDDDEEEGDVLADTGDTLKHINTDNEVDLKNRKQDGAVWEMGRNKGRKLLVEKTMSGGCLAHKTAVASGALVMYLRYLCEPDAETLFSNKRKLHSIEPLPMGNKKDKLDEEVDNKKDFANAANEALVNNDGGGGGFERLQMNLNRENDLVNPLDKLNKFQKAFEQYQNKMNVPKGENKIKAKIDGNQHVKDGSKLVKDDDPNKDDNYEYKDYEGDDDKDDDDGDEYDDEVDPDEAALNQRVNQYDDNENNGDLKPLQDDEENADDDEKDDDYDADDGYEDGYDDNDEENVHPHINARNIGHGASQDYDKDMIDDDKKLNQVRDYDDDEDEGDDYQYDDENDVVEHKNNEKTQDEFILAKPDKKVKDIREKIGMSETISKQSMLSTTTVVIFLISLVVIIILYRFLRRRRIRLRIGHNYFHV